MVGLSSSLPVEPGPPQAGSAVYQTNTGFAPIDAIRYWHQPQIDWHHHRDTDILLYRRNASSSIDCMTTAERDAGEPDMLFIANLAGAPAFGRLGGAPFQVAANRTPQMTFVPRLADGKITYRTAAFSSHLLFPQGYLAKLVAEHHHGEFAPLLFGDDNRLVQLTRMLEAEIAAPGFASRLLVEGLSRAIASLLASIDTQAIDADIERIHLPPWKLRRVVDYVMANLENDICLEDLANLANLSPFHFSRVFKRATGMTPYHFVREQRLDRSRALLSHGGLPISEVALACGFSNQSHFTAAFSKAMGVSPARFRRMMQE